MKWNSDLAIDAAAVSILLLVHAAKILCGFLAVLFWAGAGYYLLAHQPDPVWSTSAIDQENYGHRWAILGMAVACTVIWLSAGKLLDTVRNGTKSERDRAETPTDP